VHSEIGNSCVGAKVNGRLMPLRYQLQNGDRVEIISSRGGTPSPQWLRFVVTGYARSVIRRTILAEEREVARAAGTRTFEPTTNMVRRLRGPTRTTDP
jgi:GTP pyrophosphokinase